MSHYYVQQLVHVIWSTQNQKFKIPESISTQLYAYISAIIKSKEGKLYFAGGHNDHLHCLLSLPPTISIATMMQVVKYSTSKWIKNQNSMNHQFSWENGYTAISIQNDRVDAVCSYIKDEKQRHEKLSYGDELAKILKLQNIQYDEKYFLTKSHSKLFLHMIWSTKNRIPRMDKSIRPFIYEVMNEAAYKKNCVVHAIGGVEDHVHLLIDVSRTIALSDLVQEIKGSASRWLSTNDRSFLDFDWQTGYGAFSISASTVGAVKQYIMQQEEHHKQSTYSVEWNEFLLKKGLMSY